MGSILIFNTGFHNHKIYSQQVLKMSLEGREIQLHEIGEQFNAFCLILNSKKRVVQ
jgi:hypothetical protein